MSADIPIKPPGPVPGPVFPSHQDHRPQTELHRHPFAFHLGLSDSQLARIGLIVPVQNEDDDAYFDVDTEPDKDNDCISRSGTESPISIRRMLLEFPEPPSSDTPTHRGKRTPRLMSQNKSWRNSGNLTDAQSSTDKARKENGHEKAPHHSTRERQPLSRSTSDPLIDGERVAASDSDGWSKSRNSRAHFWLAAPRLAPLEYTRRYLLEKSYAERTEQECRLQAPELAWAWEVGHKRFFVLPKIPSDIDRRKDLMVEKETGSYKSGYRYQVGGYSVHGRDSFLIDPSLLRMISFNEAPPTPLITEEMLQAGMVEKSYGGPSGRQQHHRESSPVSSKDGVAVANEINLSATGSRTAADAETTPESPDIFVAARHQGSHSTPDQAIHQALQTMAPPQDRSSIVSARASNILPRHYTRLTGIPRPVMDPSTLPRSFYSPPPLIPPRSRRRLGPAPFRVSTAGNVPDTRQRLISSESQPRLSVRKQRGGIEPSSTTSTVSPVGLGIHAPSARTAEYHKRSTHLPPMLDFRPEPESPTPAVREKLLQMRSTVATPLPPRSASGPLRDLSRSFTTPLSPSHRHSLGEGRCLPAPCPATPQAVTCEGREELQPPVLPVPSEVQDAPEIKQSVASSLIPANRAGSSSYTSQFASSTHESSQGSFSRVRNFSLKVSSGNLLRDMNGHRCDSVPASGSSSSSRMAGGRRG